jgi:hypothetical protein
MIWEGAGNTVSWLQKIERWILVFIVWFVATNSEISEQYREQLAAEGLGTQTDRVLNYVKKLRKDRRKFFADFCRQLSAV